LRRLLLLLFLLIPTRLALAQAATAQAQFPSGNAFNRGVGATAAVPASCAPGDLYFATDAAAGQNIYMCPTSTFVQQVAGGGAGTVTSLTATAPIVATPSPVTATGVFSCATCVTSAAALTSTALTTGGGSQALQTPSATSTLTAAGNMSLPGTLGVTGHVTFEGVTSTGASGTGLLVFNNSPAFITPALGTPASGTATNETGYVLNNLSGATAQGTITESSALHQITFAGVETAALTYPYSFTNANSTNNNSSGTVIISSTGTSTGAVPLLIGEAGISGAGDAIESWINATVTNGVESGGALKFAVSANGIVLASGSSMVIGAGDYTNATTSPTAIFNLPLPATTVARNYRYSCNFMWQSTTATAVGPVFSTTLSAAPTNYTSAGIVQNTLAGADTTGYVSTAATTIQTVVTGGVAGVQNTEYWATLWGNIEGANTAGSTWTISANATSAFNLAIKRGSSCFINGY
jgi:hypothetical protein